MTKARSGVVGNKISPSRVAVGAAGELAARGAWEEAYQKLAIDDGTTQLSGNDLEALATAAYMTGREEKYADILARAFEAFSAEGIPLRAARAAFWIGLTLMFRGEMGRGSGWLARCEGIVKEQGTNCAERGYVLLPRVEGAFAAGDIAEAERLASEALKIGEQCGDPDLTEMARHLIGRARIVSGAMHEGIALLDETMLAAAERQLSPIATGLIYCSVIEAYQKFQVLDRAREWTEALTTWCAEQPQLVAFTGRCLIHRSEILTFDGKWSHAVEEASAACQRLKSAPNEHHAGPAYYQKGEVMRLSGRFDEADESFRAASRLGFDPQPGLALMSLRQGRLAAAWAGIRRSLVAVNSLPERMRLLPATVEIALAAGAMDQAEQYYLELEELVRKYSSDASLASAAEARGDLRRAQGDVVAALQDYERAAVLWRKLGAPYQLARVRLKKGRVCDALGDCNGARAEVEAARDGFRGLGAEPDRRAADAVLRQIDPREPALLTPRQAEVLRHVARGLTNREIASKLKLSERTVDRHVSDILTRIDAPSRAAAVAIALSAGLIDGPRSG